MKILSWNCNGKFREKFSILNFDYDIAIIQECENPKTSNDKNYIKFAKNYIWFGENNNKGLGIFAKDTIILNNNNWPHYCLRHFISAEINKSFNILAVWASKPYIEEYYIYQSINEEKYNNKMVIIGDFNSNVIWDKKHQTRNFSNVISKLEKIGLTSAYHFVNKEEYGKETQKTFYLYRHTDKGYHIDYAFADRDNIKTFKILNENKWLKYSDHIPILLELNTDI